VDSVSPHPKNKTEARKELRFSAGFFLGVLLDPEDAVDIFLRNVGPSSNYATLQTTLHMTQTEETGSAGLLSDPVYTCVTGSSGKLRFYL
jgi:hypothetical protein